MDTRQFVQSLRYTADQIHKASARALQKVSFDVVEALKAEARTSFPQATPRGVTMLAGRGSYIFDLDPNTLTSTIRPGVLPGKHPEKRRQLLAEHAAGALVFESKLRLGLAGQDLLAVPLGEAAAARRRAGRVPKALEPAVLLQRGRGFLVMRGTRGVLRQRRGGRGRGGSRTVALYAVMPAAQLPKRFDWLPTIRRTAERQIVPQMQKQLGRLAAPR
jgi:hypothetical protein